MYLVLALLGALRAILRTRADLALENLALRQQLAVLRRHSKRPQPGPLDRAFWACQLAVYQRRHQRVRTKVVDRLLWALLSRTWASWRDALVFVQPGTVIVWQRRKFRDLLLAKTRSRDWTRSRPGATLEQCPSFSSTGRSARRSQDLQESGV
jgi:hypothetical protein